MRQLLTCIGIIAFSILNAQKISTVTGVMRLQEDTNIVFLREIKKVKPQGDTLYIKTQYEREGKVIADKYCAFYNANSCLPNYYEINNKSTGRYERIKCADKTCSIKFRRNSDDKLDSSTVTFENNTVHDEGINRYISKNWSKLKEGKTITVNVLVPSRLAAYEFEIKLNENTNTVTLSPSSFLLKQFVSDMLLTYDVDGKHIVKFSGLTNVTYDERKLPKIQSVYTY